MSPTRCMLRGTSSSIPTEFRAGWQRLTWRPTAAWRSTKISSWISAICAATRSGLKVETRPRTSIAIHERDLALGGARIARRLSRPQPWNGLAVRLVSGFAGEDPAGGLEGARADQSRSRRRDFADDSWAAHRAGDCVAGRLADRGRSGTFWHGTLPAFARPSSPGRGNESRVWRLVFLVVSYGGRTRCGIDAGAHPAGPANAGHESLPAFTAQRRPGR